MKEVFAPHLNRTVKFGRVRSKPDAGRRRLKFGDYVQASLPPPPGSTDYSAQAMASLSNVYCNDALGCCTISGINHIHGVTTGNADGGQPFVATNDQIISAYSACGGYVPGDPSTDQGCDEQTVLDYFQSTGFADGTKLSGHLLIDPTKQTEVMQAQWLSENLYFGVELPDAWINPFPQASGFVWDVGTPDPDNGHCVAGVGYNDQGVQVATWGLIGTVTWAAVAALCSGDVGGELFVVLDESILMKGQIKSPAGFDWPTLLADFKALPARGGLTLP